MLVACIRLCLQKVIPCMKDLGEGEFERLHKGTAAYLGVLARASRHQSANPDGVGGLVILRDGVALCAPGGRAFA